MRILLLALLFVSCTKEKTVTPPVPYNANEALTKMFFNPEYQGADIYTRFTIPLKESINKIQLSKSGIVLDEKTNLPYGSVDLYDRSTNFFPARDSIYTFTLINSKGETSSANFTIP